MTKKYAPVTNGNESAPNKRNHSTRETSRETSDERPLYHPLTWRGTKKEAGFCFVDGLVNVLLMISGAALALSVVAL